MNSVANVTQHEFQNAVLDAKLPVVVDFYASWCPPCKMLAPILDELSTEYDGQIKIVKVNVDQEQSLASQYRLQGVPTLIFYQNGKILTQITGVPEVRELRGLFAKLAASQKQSV